MNSIILIGDDKLSVSNLEKTDFENCICVNRTDSGLALEFIDGRIYFDILEDVSYEYEPDEIKKIPIVNPRFVSLAFSSKELLKKVLLKIDHFESLIVDDDMGNIIPYNDYVAQI